MSMNESLLRRSGNHTRGLARAFVQNAVANVELQKMRMRLVRLRHTKFFAFQITHHTKNNWPHYRFRDAPWLNRLNRRRFK